MLLKKVDIIATRSALKQFAGRMKALYAKIINQMMADSYCCDYAGQQIAAEFGRFQIYPDHILDFIGPEKS